MMSEHALSMRKLLINSSDYGTLYYGTLYYGTLCRVSSVPN